MASFFVAHSFAFLDEEFDAPDIAADHELCRAVVSGRRGLDPVAWGNHDPLTLLPLRFRKPWEPPIGIPRDLRPRVEEQPIKPRPFKPPRPRQPTYPGLGGDVQLTCDECQRRFRITMYYAGGQRPAVVQSIRLLGKDEGWTCIVGRDRCPKCSQLVPPETVGHGTGTDQGDEQHP